MTRRFQSWHAYLTLFLLITANSLWAELPPTRAFFSDLSRLNLGSPLESSRAHGMEGYSVGLGLISNRFASELGKEKLGPNKGDSAVAPKIFITKGLFYPVDLGLNFSSTTNPDRQGMSITGYVQWTVFEHFAWPALAVRSLYSELHGIDNVAFATFGVEGLLSYGIGQASIYLGYGENVHDGSYKVEGIEQANYLSLSFLEGETIKDKFRERNMFFGAQIMILPPFTILAAEWRRSGYDSGQSFLAKISMGI